MVWLELRLHYLCEVHVSRHVEGLLAPPWTRIRISEGHHAFVDNLKETEEKGTCENH